MNNAIKKSDLAIVNCIKNKLDELKAEDITCIDANRPISSKFILCTASSSRHIHGITNNIKSALKKELNIKFKADVSDEWSAIETPACVVHIMQKDIRSAYDIESLISTNAKPSEDLSIEDLSNK